MLIYVTTCSFVRAMTFLSSLFKFSKVSYIIFDKCIKFSICSKDFIREVNQEYIIKKIVREQQKKMITKYDSNLLVPPSKIRGMKFLDKVLFNKKIKVATIFFRDDNLISNIMPCLKKYILKLENMKPIHKENEGEGGGINCGIYILLNPLFVQEWSDISDADKNNLKTFEITNENFRVIDLILQYENWRADEILRYILPEDTESVTSFSKIGHIVHLNLRDHLMEYKNIIGEILLDKVAGCRTVINKLNKIDNIFRNFEMEILCGDNDTHVIMKQNHCTFEFDFATVYWNPRLATEHERIVNMLTKKDVLYDVFAGIGPFAIPAAKKQVRVLANDLNPESFKWLNHNCNINKVDNTFLKSFNKDGKDFILTDIKDDLKMRFEKNDYENIYITMNLPAAAPNFLQFFKGLLNSSDLKENTINKLPKVFVYCFAKGDNPPKIARTLVEKSLGRSLPEKCEIFNVRTVSNFKEMMRVSFELPRDYLFVNSHKRYGNEISEDGETSDLKKFCHGEKEIQSIEKCLQGSGSQKFEDKKES